MRFHTNLLLLLLLAVAALGSPLRLSADGTGTDGTGTGTESEGTGSDDGDHDDEGCFGVSSADDCAENRVERKIKIEFDQQKGFKVESRVEMGEYRDVFDLDFEGDGDKLEVDWKVRTSNDTTQTGFRFRFRLFSLIEYEAAANATTNAYVQGESTLCATTPIIGDNFSWSASKQVINNATVSSITGTDGVVSVVGHLAGDYEQETDARDFTLDGYVITPRSFKFDVDLDLTKYQWASNCTSPRVALVTFVKSASRISEAGTQINFGDAALDAARNTGGVFTFANVANLNGTTDTVNILTSSLVPVRDSDDDANDDASEFVSRAVFSFDSVKPQTLHWDPIMTAALRTGSASVLSVASALVVALFAALF